MSNSDRLNQVPQGLGAVVIDSPEDGGEAYVRISIGLPEGLAWTSPNPENVNDRTVAEVLANGGRVVSQGVPWTMWDGTLEDSTWPELTAAHQLDRFITYDELVLIGKAPQQHTIVEVNVYDNEQYPGTTTPGTSVAAYDVVYGTDANRDADPVIHILIPDWYPSGWDDDQWCDPSELPRRIRRALIKAGAVFA